MWMCGDMLRLCLYTILCFSPALPSAFDPVLADGTTTLVSTVVSKVLVECQASDGTAVLGSPLSFYLWSSTARLQLSQTTLGFAGSYSCPLSPYQTAQVDVIADLTNPDTTPSLIQANIYGLVRDKVRTCVYTCTTQCTQDMHVHCVLCVCVCACLCGLHRLHTCTCVGLFIAVCQVTHLAKSN